ncbi:PASTA domain-containing protein [Pseudonocardia parietis]|uniref:Beta-lactam-binding protein with PASTA domain n=1 Tax=Pseudonocardia parietis TaxID=570936 RepID=A0ABS4VVB6_9PSEU|nr:PASTA domain-containing protein [Pseudonocardia parietis]MBP2367874.1 beta-lactam-binding protein with PASTA domain [Pseudonocardia parietis]
MTTTEQNRREAVVTVPDLAGLDLPRAHDTALDGGLLAVEHETSDDAPQRRVVRQDPASGIVARYGSTVTVWAAPPPPDSGGGGGSGVAPVGPGPVLSGQG